MLRLDPGDLRIATTRQFTAWEGGGEYNVARGLHRCFGLDTAIVTALVDNPVGRLVEDLIRQGGVDRSLIRWVAVRRRRARGAQRPQLHRARLRRARRRRRLGPRPHGRLAAAAGRRRLGCACSATAGVRWLHCRRHLRRRSRDSTAGRRRRGDRGGAAARHADLVRPELPPSLWQSIGGPSAAAAVNRELVAAVDVMIGNEEDFQLASASSAASDDEHLLELDPGRTASCSPRPGGLPEPALRRGHAAQRALGERQRLGRGRAGHREVSCTSATLRQDLEISTASAAVTRSPRA